MQGTYLQRDSRWTPKLRHACRDLRSRVQIYVANHLVQALVERALRVVGVERHGVSGDNAQAETTGRLKKSRQTTNERQSVQSEKLYELSWQILTYIKKLPMVNPPFSFTGSQLSPVKSANLR